MIGTLARVSSSTTSTVEPVTVPELKRHLRITHNEDDLLLQEIIPAAREMVETEIGGASLRVVPYDWTIPCFPTNGDTRLTLPKPPAKNIESIGYVDTSGSTQTWASTDYTVFADKWSPGWVLPNYAVSWPSVRVQEDAVTVRLNAGCVSTDVPQKARLAIKMVAGFYYENPESYSEGRVSDDVGLGVRRLTQNLRWGSYQ